MQIITRFLPLLFVLLVYCIRFKRISSSVNFLTLSLCVVFSSVSIISILEYSKDMIGEFGSTVYLYPSLFFGLYFYLKNNIKISVKINFWSFAFLLLIVCNHYTKGNVFPAAIYIPLFSVGQLLFYLYTVKKSYSTAHIIEGLYEAFVCWTYLEFLLTLLYPILGVDQVANLFSSIAQQWSLKREGYVSAVGTYSHPGFLAYSCAIYSIFFLSCYFNNYKKKSSLLYLLINCFVIYFTYSRTTFVCFFVIVGVLYTIYKAKMFSFKYLVYLFSFAIILLVISYIPSINKLFFHSDSDQMMESRQIHWFLGLNIWENFKLLGCGINAHVYYMETHFNKLTALINENEFLVSNPIHNIHIIILAETGVVGICLWLLYLSKELYYGYKYMLSKNILNRFCGTISFSVLLFLIMYGFFGWVVCNISILTIVVSLLFLLDFKK